MDRFADEIERRVGGIDVLHENFWTEFAIAESDIAQDIGLTVNPALNPYRQYPKAPDIAPFTLGAESIYGLLARVMARDIFAVAQKSPCEGNRVIMGERIPPQTRPAWTRRSPGGAHENPEAIIRPRAQDLST
jgi:hypothetical protein